MNTTTEDAAAVDFKLLFNKAGLAIVLKLLLRELANRGHISDMPEVYTKIWEAYEAYGQRYAKKE